MAKFAGELLSLNTYLVDGAIDILKQHYRILSEELPKELVNDATLAADGEIWQGAGCDHFVQFMFEVDLVELNHLAMACEAIASFIQEAKAQIQDRDGQLVQTADDLRLTYNRLINLG